MTIVYRSEKGSPLTKEELDDNFHDLDDRVEILETEGPLGIASIESEDGTSLTITLTDNTEQGPFPLPVATFNPAGEWTNSTPYAYLDIVNVRSRGTYLVLINHTTPDAPAEFDPAAGESDGDYYFPISEARDVDYDISFSFHGFLPSTETTSTDADDELIGQHIVIRDLIMEAPLSLARAWLETPGSVDVGLNITKNGEVVGTIVFTIDQNIGAFTFADDVELTIGDRVGIVLTESDGFAANLSVTIPTRRVDI